MIQVELFSNNSMVNMEYNINKFLRTLAEKDIISIEVSHIASRNHQGEDETTYMAVVKYRKNQITNNED